MVLIGGNGFTALLHEPFGGRGGTTDAYSVDALQPCGVYLLWSLNEVGIVVHAPAFVEKHLAVAALMAADKEDEVVASCKLRDVGHAVGHLSANGVEALEGDTFLDVGLYEVDDTVELVERLRGL